MTKLNTYILLDRSGSMSVRWDETLSSINAYVQELVTGGTKGKITVATFDHQAGMQFDVIRDAVKMKQYQPLTNDDAQPRGGTPLYDAIGRIVNLARSLDKKRTVIVIMTDGMENSSREMSQGAAKAALDRCRDRDWQVVMLGADFDAFTQGGQIGIDRRQTINTVIGSYGNTMRGLAGQSTNYAVTGSAVSFSDEDRKAAAGEAKS